MRVVKGDGWWVDENGNICSLNPPCGAVVIMSDSQTHTLSLSHTHKHMRERERELMKNGGVAKSAIYSTWDVTEWRAFIGWLKWQNNYKKRDLEKTWMWFRLAKSILGYKIPSGIQAT